MRAKGSQGAWGDSEREVERHYGPLWETGWRYQNWVALWQVRESTADFGPKKVGGHSHCYSWLDDCELSRP